MGIQIEHIKKSFGKKIVLQDINLEASNGDCIAILGENGCGKSTFLSILCGILKSDGGSFTYEGQDMLRPTVFRKNTLGYVPQGTPLLEELSALDNLKLWYSFTDADLKKDLKYGVPAMLGVSEFLDVAVSKMSGGMKKRLSISCAVAHSPKILLLDEPSAALDLSCKEKIFNYLRTFKDNGGIILLATHDIQDLPLCNKFHIMKQGVLTPYNYDGNVHALVGQL